jgi:hypothetical protein
LRKYNQVLQREVIRQLPVSRDKLPRSIGRLPLYGIENSSQLKIIPFSNYATFGNNDRWIAIQDYQNEDWTNMIQLWKFSLLHFCHVIKNIDDDKLLNEWIAGPDKTISLKTMIVDFPRHLKLHISEINDLINTR